MKVEWRVLKKKKIFRRNMKEILLHAAVKILSLNKDR